MKKFALALALGAGLFAAGAASAETYDFTFGYPVLNGTPTGGNTIVDGTFFSYGYTFTGSLGRNVDVTAVQSLNSFATSTSAYVYQGVYGLGVFSADETKLSQPSGGVFNDVSFSSTYVDSVGLYGERLCFDFGTVGGNQVISKVTFDFADTTDRATVGVFAGAGALAPLAIFNLGQSSSYTVEFVPPLSTTKLYIGAIDSGTQHSSFTVEGFNFNTDADKTVSTVPLPNSLWAGLGLLGCVGLVGLRRKLAV